MNVLIYSIAMHQLAYCNSNSPPHKESLRGAEAPLFIILPLSFQGEGDKGGEVIEPSCFVTYPPLLYIRLEALSEQNYFVDNSYLQRAG